MSTGMDLAHPTKQAIKQGSSDQRGGAMEAYVRWLREELDSERWSADPDQPCLLHKLYESGKQYALDNNIPLHLGLDYAEAQRLEARAFAATPTQKLSWLLYYIHGLTRIQRTEAGRAGGTSAATLSDRIVPGQHIGPGMHFSPYLGRIVPSGGSLHPLEIYLALNKDWGLPAGVYHYDSAHHRLNLLREGEFLTQIFACLPENEKQQGSAVVFISVYMQKNHQKYTELSYSLQMLDAGIAVAQTGFVAPCLGLVAQTSFNFLDYPLHALLGLDTTRENIYGLTTLLPVEQKEEPAGHLAPEPHSSARSVEATGALLSSETRQPFPLRPSAPLLQHLYAASLLEQVPDRPEPYNRIVEEAVDQEKYLPEPVSYRKQDLAQLLLRRHTGFRAIDTQAISEEQLSALLAPLHRQWHSRTHYGEPWVYCALSRVTGLAAGIYRYHPQRHSLSSIHSDHLFAFLTRITTAENIQPQLAPVNLFLGGNYRIMQQVYGERGLRLLGIETGRMLQVLSLAAASCGLTSHIHLSFAVEGTRKHLLRNYDEDGILLASMMVGCERSSQAGLFETIWY